MSVILLYNSDIKSSNVVQSAEFFIAKQMPAFAGFCFAC